MDINRKKSISKGIIEVAMLLGLIGCFISTTVFEKSQEAIRNGGKPEDVFYWGTLHCIVAIIFSSIIFIHIWQHWDFCKLLITKKIYLKNKMTTLTIAIFLLTVISFLLYLIGFTSNTLHFHSIIVLIFVLIVLIHFITKFKRLISLFKK
jgi:hypothetical protein